MRARRALYFVAFGLGALAPLSVTATALTRDGRYLLVGDDEGYVGLFDIDAQTTVWRRRIYP